MLRQSGSALMALGALVATALLVWGGLRPLARMLTSSPQESAQSDFPALLPAGDGMDGMSGIGGASGDMTSFPAPQTGWGDSGLMEDLTFARSQSPQRRLEQIIEIDEDRAVAVLRQWIRQGEAA
jgi:flagellar M-ring protein FliF